MPRVAPPRARLLRARSAAASNAPGSSGPEPRQPEPSLGQKVSILYRLAGDEHPFSEVVGIVQRITDGAPQGPDGRSGGPVLAVLRRNGDLVEVPRADIVRMKIVPTGGGAPIRPPKSWSSGRP
jgi:hypothetical protein